MDGIQTEGFVQQSRELDHLMMSNPDMENMVRRLIRKVIAKARKDMSEAAKASMKASPRQTYRAVKSAIYRQILGGNVSLLNKRSVNMSNYEPERTLKSGQRGGNRKKRSARTDDLIHYAGDSRGFILRFLNAGTDDRAIKNFKSDPHRDKVKRGSQGGDVNKYGNVGKVNTGNRGHIAPRNFFAQNEITIMNKASETLVAMIDDLIAKESK